MSLQKVWHWGHDLDPTRWEDANRMAVEMIEQEEQLRSPILLGRCLGKIEERAWIRKCFEVAQGDQMENLIGRLLDGSFPKAFRQPDGEYGRAIFYEFEEDCPDGPMD